MCSMADVYNPKEGEYRSFGEVNIADFQFSPYDVSADDDANAVLKDIGNPLHRSRQNAVIEGNQYVLDAYMRTREEERDLSGVDTELYSLYLNNKENLPVAFVGVEFLFKEDTSVTAGTYIENMSKQKGLGKKLYTVIPTTVQALARKYNTEITHIARNTSSMDDADWEQIFSPVFTMHTYERIAPGHWEKVYTPQE